MKTKFRDKFCGDVNKEDLGKEISLCGWVRKVRHLGRLSFIDLRDREGYIQCVVVHKESNKKISEVIKSLNREDCIRVKGIVREREDKDKNPELKTGNYEVELKEIEILSRSKETPFLIDDNIEVFEETRLKYRFLDLRREKIQKGIILKHKVMQTMREILNSEGFIEIETPYLAKSTPEGARDFLVPSRIYPKKFYALPQSPQLYKQILMISGFDRYYQFARCFRDEDLRKDRQPEFTQLDLEMSFVDENDIFSIVEKILSHIFKNIQNKEIKIPFSRIVYKECIEKYGIDKPDLRVKWQLEDVTEKVLSKKIKFFENSHKVLILFIDKNVPLPRSYLDNLKEPKEAKISWLKKENRELKGPLSKSFEIGEFKEDGTYIFLGGTIPHIFFTGGAVRQKIITDFKPFKENEFAFTWVVDFPYYVWNNEEQKWEISHHPFTMPKEPWGLDKKPEDALSKHYDLVLNGVEIGSGSVRIHNEELQRKVLKKIGYNEKQIEEHFGFFLQALSYGAPPHAGIALGLERIVAIIGQMDSIRNAIAFPKTTKAQALYEGAPSEATPSQLKELHIKVEE